MRSRPTVSQRIQQALFTASFAFLCTFAFMVMVTVAFAQDATQPLPTEDFLALLLQSIGQVKGATGMGIAVLVTQLIMAFFRTPLANFAGKFRLVIVMVLSLAAGLLALKLSGVTWAAALVHSSTLAAFQVLAHQLYVQFIKKGDEVPKSAPTTT